MDDQPHNDGRRPFPTIISPLAKDPAMMGLLKKSASGVPYLRRSGFASRAEALRRASAQAGRHFSVLTYSAYAPRVKMAAALLDGLF